MGAMKGPWRWVLAAILLAGCGGGEGGIPRSVPPPSPAAPAMGGPDSVTPADPGPSSAPGSALPKEEEEGEGEEEDRPPPALPFSAPGEDPDFPAKRPPEPGDWLAHFDEPGQTAEEYRFSCTNRLVGIRRRILVQPLGRIAEKRRATLESVRRFLAAFFAGADVEIAEPLPLDPDAWKEERGQYFAPAVLGGLGNRLRGTTLACLALCGEDLYAEDLNFVFGLASPRLRTGVFSLGRYDGDGEGTFLRRTLKVGAHETGHLLGLEHCVRYECLMNGSNNLDEADRAPLFECPECREKLRWNLGFDPAARWEGLAAVLAGEGLGEEAAFARRRAAKSRSR